MHPLIIKQWREWWNANILPTQIDKLNTELHIPKYNFLTECNFTIDDLIFEMHTDAYYS